MLEKDHTKRPSIKEVLDDELFKEYQKDHFSLRLTKDE